MSKRINVANLPEFDVAAYLTDEETISAFLADIREDNNEALLAMALDDVARARAMLKGAKTKAEEQAAAKATTEILASPE